MPRKRCIFGIVKPTKIFSCDENYSSCPETAIKFGYTRPLTVTFEFFFVSLFIHIIRFYTTTQVV